MTVIFVLLSMVVSIFLIMTILTLLRIEKSIRISQYIAEKKIVKTFGRKSGEAEDDV